MRAKETMTMISFADPLPTLKQAEKLLVAEAMKCANGDQAVAAMSSGILCQALNNRLKGREY